MTVVSIVNPIPNVSIVIVAPTLFKNVTCLLRLEADSLAVNLYKHKQVIHFQYTVAQREDWEASKERLDQSQTGKTLNYIVLCLAYRTNNDII